MSGKDLYDFIHAHGYAEYASDVNLQDSLKPSPKSLDWLFAFPKMNKFLVWLMDDCQKFQIFPYNVVKAFNKLPLKVPQSRLEDLNELLAPEPTQDFQTPDTSIISQELKNLIHEQESQIKFLESQLNEKENFEHPEKLLESIENENNELEHNVLQYLENFSQICPTVTLQTVQGYLKADEELTEKIVDYCKVVDLCVGAIDSSVFQRCLKSEKADEFTSLCMEKQELEITAIENNKQLLLASAALEKTRTTLKTFEKLITTRLHPDNPDSEILLKTEELENITQETLKILKAIEETCKNLQKCGSDQSHYDDFELFLKKNEFSTRKHIEINKTLQQQNKNILLALSSIQLEMSEVQSEYEKLFNIQTFFTDLHSQSQFRLSHYPKYKLRSEILSNETKTIDERNEFYNKLCLYLNIQPRSTFEEIFAAINKVKMLAEVKKKASQENLQNFESQAKKIVFNLQKVVNEVRDRVLTEEGVQESEEILKGVEEMEACLVEFVKEFELANERVVVGNLGITERDVFVEYLLSSEPGFFKECQLSNF